MYRVRKQIDAAVTEAGNEKLAVAVLDTGVVEHPDLRGRIKGFQDFIEGGRKIYDDSGHGTHVCGIIGGNGALSGGKYRGIAPSVNLVVGKVLDKKGDGTVEAMLDGIDWVLEKKSEWNIRILNISVGIGRLMNEEKEAMLKNKLENAWKKGLLVVCAAGNNGPACDTLSSIGKSKLLITVGCHDGEYFQGSAKRCAAYSSRGDRFDTGKKPDIVAPGTEIISCNGGVSRGLGGYSNAYISKSGTSMATPIISGALALLVQKHPEYDNETAKRKLLYTATDLGEPWYQQGWGMVNVKRLLEG
ncbi:MAG: S8 family peptidase [Lachnospiraceae bacterium]|nr:S8 family peptidase [Lachnospiraceae bacterium]